MFGSEFDKKAMPPGDRARHADGDASAPMIHKIPLYLPRPAVVRFSKLLSNDPTDDVQPPLHEKQKAREARIKFRANCWKVKFAELNRAPDGNKRVDENILPQRPRVRCSHHKER
jgi:hypothetical protein